MPRHTAVGKAQRLRPLLPGLDTRTPLVATKPIPKLRKNTVRVACKNCRKGRSKCSGERPACHRCVQRRLECYYTTQPGETTAQALTRNYHDLKTKSTVHEELFDLLKRLPDSEALDILRRIRSGTDISTILSHVKAGDILLQMSVLPETRFRYQFPYGSEMPEHCVSNNPYLDSLVYEAASLYSPDTQHSGWPESAASNANLGRNEYQDIYIKPFHAAQVIEPRLFDSKISSWTTVCDDDVLMRDLLSVFLRCEYHFTAAFQKDYFLDDLAARRGEFCSSLLVNIVLAYSCVCYPRFLNRAEYWNPHTLVYRFLAEAKRIWELESNEATVTTIQAGILFSVFYNLCGLDEIGQPYRIHTVTLAHKLRLFDIAVEGQSDRTRNGREFAAWTLYNWETLVGFSFMHSPLLKEPPKWRLPDPSNDAQWYGEIWVKYPLSQSLTPSYFGEVFRAKCKFRVIMNDFCQAAYSEGSGVTLDKAKQLLSQLKRWYEDLSGPLMPKTVVLPGQLQLHIYYHHLILAIYEPLLDTETDQGQFLQQVVADARKHLETLVRLYFIRHGFEAMDLFIVIPLMLAATNCLDAIDEHTPVHRLEALRSTLILAARGLYSQRRNHYLAEALFRVIRGRMRPQEVSLLKGTIHLDEDDADSKKDTKRDMAQPVRSHWPVSVVRKKEDLDCHVLTNLVQNYAHLNVEEDEESP